MSFSNAYHGVKKIFTSQLLKVIGTACMLIGAILGVIALVLVKGILSSAELSAETVEALSPTAAIMGIVALVLVVASGVLSIIAYIMNIVGLRQGSQDEDSFKLGFYFACFAMIIKFVSILFILLNVGGGIADNIADTIGSICDIIILVSVIGGIVNLANRLGVDKVAVLGGKLMNLIIAIYVLAAIAFLVPVFFGMTDTFQFVQGILMLVSASLSFVGCIVFLVLLGKAKKMLKEN